MTNQIVFVDSRGVITNNRDALVRHEYYVNEYTIRLEEEAREKIKFIFLSGRGVPSVTTTTNENIKIHYLGKHPRISLKFIYRSFVALKSVRCEIRGFICGDPWETFWTTYLIRMLLRNRNPIQTNIHADVFDPKWVSQSLANRIRHATVGFAINKSNIVRTVSHEVRNNILSRYPGVMVIYAPIPIMVAPISKSLQNSTEGKKTIGWVGRLAEDRGVYYFIKLIDRLNRLDSNFDIIIAGNGPLGTETEQHLRSILEDERLILLGQVNQSELAQVYRAIDVLISCAASESYGLSMREALVCGKPVWAVESIGSKKLQADFGTEYVKFLDLIMSDSELERDFHSISNTQVPSGISTAILASNRKHLTTLFDSWDSLLSFHKAPGDS
jgi:glycosyltransferase involved in cell wall biosynthesis